MTKKELNAVRTLQRLVKRWPESLWIFAAGSDLTVMRYGDDGRRMMTESGGVDPDYIVQSIDGIPCDGGDW